MRKTVEWCLQWTLPIAAAVIILGVLYAVAVWIG